MKIESMDRTSRVLYKDNQQNTQSKLSKRDLAARDSEVTELISEISERVAIKQDSPDGNEINIDGQISKEYIRSEISKAKEKMNSSTSLEFSYHEATKTVAIKVIDKKTKDVIREIPPEKSLDMLQKMWELAGILIDEKR